MLRGLGELRLDELFASTAGLCNGRELFGISCRHAT